MEEYEQKVAKEKAELMNSKQFKNKLKYQCKVFHRNFEEVKPLIVQLHYLHPFKFVHEFYSVHELAFLYIEELIKLYRLQNPEENKIKRLDEKLKKAFLFSKNQVYKSNNTVFFSKLDRLLGFLRNSKILTVENEKAIEIYKELLGEPWIPSLTPLSFYIPDLVDRQWAKREEDENISHRIIPLSKQVYKDVVKRMVEKLEIEGSILCDLIQNCLTKEADIRTKLLAQGEISYQDNATCSELVQNKQTKFRKYFLSIFLPKLREFGNLDVFLLSKEASQKWSDLFDGLVKIAKQNLMSCINVTTPESHQKCMVLGPLYYNQFVSSYAMKLQNILYTKTPFQTCLKTNEAEVEGKLPLDILSRDLFLKFVERYSPKKTVSRVQETTVPTKPRQANPSSKKNSKSRKKGKEKSQVKAKEQEKEISSPASFSKSAPPPREITVLNIEQIFPSSYERVSDRIHALSMNELSSIKNVSSLRNLAWCVGHIASLYRLIEANEEVKSFALYASVVEMTSRAIEQLFRVVVELLRVQSPLNYPIHNLGFLHRMISPQENAPKIVRNQYLATYWVRYPAEQVRSHSQESTFITTGNKVPKVLKKLHLLARNEKAIDGKILKVKSRQILEETINLVVGHLGLDIAKESKEKGVVSKQAIGELKVDRQTITDVVGQFDKIVTNNAHEEEKVFQIKNYLKTMNESLDSAMEATDFPLFSFWVQNVVWQLQIAVSESLVLLIYKQTNVSIRTHEVSVLAAKAALPLSEEEKNAFTGLSNKSRYPAQNTTSLGGQIIDWLEALSRYPEINEGFVVSEEGDPWHLPKKGVTVDQVKDNLALFMKIAFGLLQNKILPNLLPKPKKEPASV